MDTQPFAIPKSAGAWLGDGELAYQVAALHT